MRMTCADAACGHLSHSHDAATGRCSYRDCKCAGLLVGLTGRELEVLKKMATGLSVKEIGAALFIHEKTVSAHKFNMMQKTGARSRIELVLAAVRSGVLQLEDLPKFTARVECSAD